MITILIICLIRALLFKPIPEKPVKEEKSGVEQEKAVTNLQALIRCKTVSNLDKSLEDQKEFDKLEATLRSNCPNVFNKMQFTKLSPRAFLFYLPGKSGNHRVASIMMAHFDVVDAVPENWSVPPFAGIRKDGVLYGRGTIDTKGTLNGAMTAMDALLEEGFVPENDLYFAFAGDEEIQGGSAKLAVKYFQDRQIEPLVVVDEGGGVVNGIFPGVKQPMACIGTAEKGALSMEFSLEGEGGHASTPAPHTPVGKLAKLAVSIEDHPAKYHLSGPVKQMFDTLGRRSSFGYRFLFANLWLFNPVIDHLTKKSGGALNALVRSTTALTMMRGAPVTNVVPSDAMIGLNMRLLPGDDVDKEKQRLIDLAKKEGLNPKVSVDYEWNASRVSTSQCHGYDQVHDAIIQTWGQDVVVTPFLMYACADARHYGVISDKVYRFSAMKLRPEQLNMIHGDDESLSEKQIGETADFYYHLLKSC